MAYLENLYCSPTRHQLTDKAVYSGLSESMLLIGISWYAGDSPLVPTLISYQVYQDLTCLSFLLCVFDHLTEYDFSFKKEKPHSSIISHISGISCSFSIRFGFNLKKCFWPNIDCSRTNLSIRVKLNIRLNVKYNFNTIFHLIPINQEY